MNLTVQIKTIKNIKIVSEDVFYKFMNMLLLCYSLETLTGKVVLEVKHFAPKSLSGG